MNLKMQVQSNKDGASSKLYPYSILRSNFDDVVVKEKKSKKVSFNENTILSPKGSKLPKEQHPKTVRRSAHGVGGDLFSDPPFTSLDIIEERFSKEDEIDQSIHIKILPTKTLSSTVSPTNSLAMTMPRYNNEQQQAKDKNITNITNATNSPRIARSISLRNLSTKASEKISNVLFSGTNNNSNKEETNNNSEQAEKLKSSKSSESLRAPTPKTKSF